MSQNSLESLANHSMSDLFRMEVETQSAVLTECLLAMERDPGATNMLQDMMRAAHSLKGAARIVGRDAAVQVAHSMEDCIVAVQNRKLTISDRHVNALLAGVDLLGRIAQVPDEALDSWGAAHQTEIEAFLASFSLHATPAVNPPPTAVPQSPVPSPGDAPAVDRPNKSEIDLQTPAQTENTAKPSRAQERVFRVRADNLARLLGLAGEARVGSRWLDTFTKEMMRLKQLQQGLARNLDVLGESLAEASLSKRSAGRLNEFHDRMANFQQWMVERLAELERFDRRLASLSTRLYDEVLDCRMRPFADGIQMFARVTRDLAHSLGKTARLEIIGESTTVDRDILERLKA